MADLKLLCSLGGLLATVSFAQSAAGGVLPASQSAITPQYDFNEKPLPKCRTAFCSL